ncbi:hypothetical protein GCM10029978_088000 [Actinoallomurus acanthiterrae]
MTVYHLERSSDSDSRDPGAPTTHRAARLRERRGNDPDTPRYSEHPTSRTRSVISG